MRKIFSAALALVCVWFATPALADLDPCRNLLDPEWTQNKGTDGNNGNVVNSAGWSITDLIPVEPGQYVWSMSALYQTYTFYYDTNKQFISPHGGPKDTQERQITIPSNAKYVRLQIKAVGDSLSSMQQQLERGDTATAYTPYNPLCATCDGTVVNYTSATGTVSQAGTPTPTNPIEPTFYTQGNMVLRKVGNVADSYDASTGKITRRVGVAVLDGTERWGSHASNAGWFQLSSDIFPTDVNTDALSTHYRQYTHNPSSMANQDILFGRPDSSTGRVVIRDAINFPDVGLADDFKSWLAQQYAAGTPVTVYYPLKTETTEDWPASYCETPIKIATTKYNESAFGPLNTALANAISVVDSVVSNTITQAASIATLQAQKQTRPNDIADDNEKCPAGKKCLLVEDASGVPHWYEIAEQYSRLPDGYTELQYIESSGTQYIDTGIVLNSKATITTVGQFLRTSSAQESVIAIWGFMGGSGNLPRWGSGIFTGAWLMALNATDGDRSANTDKHTFVNETNGINEYNSYVDGTSIYGTDMGMNYHETYQNNTLSAYLFARNNNNTARNFSSSRVYSYNIVQNNVEVINLIPARRNSDNVVGMYDTVEGRFYTNAGTGEFVAGPVAE